MIMINLMYVVDDLRLGGPVIFSTVLKYLDKTKYRITVCCLFGGGELVPEIESYGIKVHVLGFRRWKPWLILKLAYLMHRLDIQIVHTHLFASNMIGRIAAYLAGVPVIIAHMRNTTQMMNRVQMMIDRGLSAITTKIIVIDKEVLNSVVKDEKIPVNKIICIHNSIDVGKFNPDIKRADDNCITKVIGKGKFCIGMVAGLSPIKGHDFLLQAMPGILKCIPDAHLVLVGDGPLRHNLEDEILNLNIRGNVSLLGSCREIPQVINQFDVIVHPCLIKGIPKSVLESMAMRKAVVVTLLSEYPNVIVNEQTALLVPPKSPQAITDAVYRLYKDPGLRARLSYQAYERVKEYFNYPRMIKELESLYDNLCK